MSCRYNHHSKFDLTFDISALASYEDANAKITKKFGPKKNILTFQALMI